MDRLGSRLRRAARDQPAARLLRHLRLRPDRPGRRSSRPTTRSSRACRGVMAINGDERLNPLRAGFPVCDTVGGLNAAFAIMAALYHRERTGEGQFIDVALLDSIMPLMGWVAANLLIGGQQPVLMGNDNFTAAPSGTFRTQDGYINIAANKQEQWEAVCRRAGRAGAEDRSALPGARHAQEEPQAADAAARGEADASSPPRTGWSCSTPRDVPTRRHPEPGGGADAAADRAPRRRCSEVPVRRASATIQLFNLTAQVREDPGRDRPRRRRACRRTPPRSWRAWATREDELDGAEGRRASSDTAAMEQGDTRWE